ncbi:MAG: hypothetical protein HY898_10870 [Deltaproteobacteria bacterium]|nr:hypothetical protein [Deltaproteobacteria bacterium]
MLDAAVLRYAVAVAALGAFGAWLPGCGSSAAGTEGGGNPDAGAQDVGAEGASGGGGAGGSDASQPDAQGGGAGEAGLQDVQAESSDASEPDAGDGATGDGPGPDGATGDWKTSLSVCWKEPGCHRAMVIAHGGEWDATTTPFLSRKAFEKAWQSGADGIEADILVTKDGVPVVAHSSPIEYYESLDCGGKKVEEMTADEVCKCHLGASFTETIQRMDDVIDWAQGKLIMEWDVKETTDLPAAIQVILAKNAADRSTILVGTGELQTAIPAIQGWEGLSYLADIGAAAEVAPMIAIKDTHHIFMLEIDRSYGDATEAQVADLIKNTVSPAGLKAYGASDTKLATVQNHLDVYHQGFDAVLSYNVPNGVKAAKQINVERGYTP